MAAGGLAAMLGGLPRIPAAQADDDLLRIGYLPITDATPLLVAHALGFFEAEGIQTTQPTRIKGWETLVRGFTEGQFNLVHLLKPIPIWMRYHNAIPVKILAWAHTNGSAIVVQGQSGIREFTDFGGRRVAIPYWYSTHNVIFQAGLRAAGIRPMVDNREKVPTDACALHVIPPPLMVKALATGHIDGYTVAEPFVAAGESVAGGKIFRFSGDIWRDHPCCVVCMHEQTTVQKPAWTQKVVNALVKAALHASTHKEEVAHLLSQDGKGYLPVPADVVKRAMTFHDPKAYLQPLALRHQEQWGSRRIGFNPYPYPSATRLMVEMMRLTLVDEKKTFLDDLSPERVSRELIATDFIQKALEKHPEWWRLPGVSPVNPFEREETFLV
ncbi:MAG: ABC transporter substrate-binding protein [Magnetococcales bacterium]|nr:ABC transporter substrate-binding protein [Magnetococcales bacterium]